jgi:hypothetical protein
MTAPTLTATAIFKLLAAGQFKPMADSDRDCFNGASENAMTLNHAGFFIIADCYDGEGLHLEMTDDEGSTWVFNVETGLPHLVATAQP